LASSERGKKKVEELTRALQGEGKNGRGKPYLGRGERGVKKHCHYKGRE